MDKMIHIKVVSTPQEFNDAMSVRRDVFVRECGIEAQKEFDGNDFGATHVLAYVDSKPAGTIRVRYFSDFAKLERCCIQKEFRKTNLSNKLMQYTYQFCAQKGYRYVVGTCKKELLHRWQNDGFSPIKGLKELTQNGMTLIPIIKNIEQAKELDFSKIPFETLNQKDNSILTEVSAPLVEKTSLSNLPKHNGYEK